ncbi:MAG: Re/Si-specific NAD(P)(+) transhydrogenase subunit alpha [Actinobacteria bacterium]|nr:Re/Si-specific NAD(P)(+) transhydrogenase subunit alpha [Actinomycetota bacterium]
MRVAVPRETGAGERRVALVPDALGRLAPLGFSFAIERDAGRAAGFLDRDYSAAGAAVVPRAELLTGIDAVVRVGRPSADEVDELASGTVLVGFLAPLIDPDGIDRLAARGIVAFAMESIPRISRAQAMDALSSQANVAGYKAALVAAERLPKFFPMLMTAAGTVAPAKVLVLGAGVAGLQAIATAHRLGAVVTAFDVRPVVQEQVESLGATFLDLGIRGEESEGGYARALSEEEQRRQQEALAERIKEFDAVITTALVPGRPAPRLIPASAVRGMRPGSVIVDLAAEAGGNCELTEPGAEVVREGVTIVGPTNLPATMPFHASQLYARNVSALLQHLAPAGELVLDFDDEITAGACVTRREVTA